MGVLCCLPVTKLTQVPASIRKIKSQVNKHQIAQTALASSLCLGYITGCYPAVYYYSGSYVPFCDIIFQFLNKDKKNHFLFVFEVHKE